MWLWAMAAEAFREGARSTLSLPSHLFLGKPGTGQMQHKASEPLSQRPSPDKEKNGGQLDKIK